MPGEARVKIWIDYFETPPISLCFPMERQFRIVTVRIMIYAYSDGGAADVNSGIQQGIGVMQRGNHCLRPKGRTIGNPSAGR